MAAAAEVAAFLQRQREAHTDATEEYTRMEDLYNRKLWHQLTVELAAFVSHPRFEGSDGSELAELYEHFIKHFEGKMNLLSLTKLVVAIARLFPNDRATLFVTSLLTKAEDSPEALTLGRAELAALKLKAGDAPACKELLDDAEKVINQMAGMDVDTHISFYTAQSSYYKQQGPAQAFYKSALLLLSYQSLDKMPPQEAASLSFDLGIAALVATGVYNLGELLQHPVVGVLEQRGDSAWLAELLRVFNAGDLEAYERLIAGHRAQLEAQPALVSHAAFLKEKIALMSLMDLVFAHVGPSADHRVPFELIAERIRLPLDEVELLVMRAMSLKLIRGEIDQVDGLVLVSWVQPRVLSMEQVGGMAELLQKWKGQVQNTLVFLEAEAPEFANDANF